MHGKAMSPAGPDCFVGGGEMGTLMRAHDWSGSPLGEPETWPQSLRSVVGLILGSRYPMFVAWGPKLAFLYNDGYAPIFGGKHPRALGLPFQEVWSEIWPDIEPLVAKALRGEATFHEDLYLVMERNGYPEDTWYSFSYSPVRDESGEVAGMFCACTETTAKVLADRRAVAERERLERMFEQAPGFMAMLRGPEHRFELTNPAYQRLIGHRDVLGKTVAEALPDAAAQGYVSLLDRVYLTGEAFTSTGAAYAMQATPDTPVDERLVDFVFQPVRDADGAVGGIFIEGYDVTERVRAETALRTSEERQRFLLGLGDAVRTLGDPEAIIAEASHVLGERLGAIRVAYAEIEEAENHAFVRGQWVAGDAPRLPDEIRLSDFGAPLVNRLRAGGTLRIEDVRLDSSTKDDLAALDRIMVRALVSVPLFKDGRFAVNLNVHQDRPRAWTDAEVKLIEAVAERTWEAVERARAEAALRISEERFRQFGEAAADALWIIDAATGRLEYLSPAFERIWGEPRERVLENLARWADFLHPDDREPVVACLPRLLTGEQLTNEYRIVRADGEVRWILDVGFPIRDASGRVVRAAGIAQDLTGRRLAEDALREGEQRLRELNQTLEQRVAERTAELSESQRRFRGIFDSALQFMALLTPDGTVVEVNRTALAWSQIEPADIIGQPFWLAAPMRGNPALQATVEAGIQRAAGGETVRGEHEMRGAGEVRAIVDFSLKPVLGEGGKPAFLVAEGRDVTALKEAQEALRQSQKMEAIGQLTGGVAHDFNNLLTPIVGSLDMLQRRALGGEREQRLIAGAMQSAERAKTIVQRLLAFARRQPLQSSPIDIGTLVAGMADLMSSTTGPQIRVAVEIGQDLPAAMVDPNQLEMALLNLGVNARDAMPDGGTLRITAAEEVIRGGHRSKLSPGRYVRLSVADTGIGMDEATVARAVEPFFSTKGIGKGTGLGLSMVHGLASQLGGTLTIQSRLGIGTNVELWLPVTDAPAQPVDGPPGAAPSVVTLGTALLVDDEDLVRMSTADMLSDLGYSVVEAASAEEALRLMQNGLRPDLLVTDHLMPGMSGADLARAVHAERPGTPVLVVSGYAESEGIAPDLPRLSKPFRTDELAGSLAQLAGSMPN